MDERAGVVTLLTDFGLRDPYVGIMKGVILGIAPRTTLVDLTHGVQRQSITEGAYLLGTAWTYFPRGAVHLAVVDPGVGSARGVLAVFAGGHLFVGPDNGLLESALRLPDARVHRVVGDAFTLPSPSRTFHGRDIFAPIAAHLCRGVSLEELGPRVSDPVRLPFAEPVEEAGGLRGSVISVDVFGNLITNIQGEDAREILGEAGVCTVGEGDGQPILGLSGTYVDRPEGEALALIGSTGRLEISVHGGSAAARFGVGLGDVVGIRPATREGGD